MPNHVRPTGDDQLWKAEVDRTIEDLKREIATLTALVKQVR